MNAPQLLVSLGDSPTGIVPVGDTSLVFGQIQLKYDTCDKANVGEWVLFDQKQAKQIVLGSTFYWIVDEALYLFKEPDFP